MICVADLIAGRLVVGNYFLMRVFIVGLTGVSCALWWWLRNFYGQVIISLAFFRLQRVRPTSVPIILLNYDSWLGGWKLFSNESFHYRLNRSFMPVMAVAPKFLRPSHDMSSFS